MRDVMNSNDVQDLTDIRPRIMFAVVAVCFLTLAGIFYFFTEADNAKVDAAEVLTSNYSSILSRINYGKPKESSATIVAATNALQDGKITNGEYKTFMSEYTLKLNELATQDYDKARHKADKETLFNMLKLNN